MDDAEVKRMVERHVRGLEECRRGLEELSRVAKSLRNEIDSCFGVRSGYSEGSFEMSDMDDVIIDSQLNYQKLTGGFYVRERNL